MQYTPTGMASYARIININPLPSSSRCRRYRNPMLLVNSYAEGDPRESVIQYGHRLTSGLV